MCVLTENSVLARCSKWLPNLAVAILLVLPLTTVTGSDLAKEKRWADQVVDQLFDGETVWLEVEGVKFLGLYTEAESETKGAVIVLHGIGVHPDWPQVINPLRVGLAENGWNTLSIQLPVLPNEAALENYAPLFAEAPPRIDAAVRYVREATSGPVFIAAHSMGVSMALHYLGVNAANEIVGLVGIGTNTGGKGGGDEEAERLRGIRLPMLDLFGEFDMEPVLTGVSTRAAVAGASGNVDFSQAETKGADHFFDGYEQQLLDTVSEWLEARR